MRFMERTKAILHYVDEHPGCTRKEIAEGIGVPLTTIGFDISQMINLRFLSVTRDRMGNHHTLTSHGHGMMVKHETVTKIPVNVFGHRTCDFALCFRCADPIQLTEQEQDGLFVCPVCHSKFEIKEVR